MRTLPSGAKLEIFESLDSTSAEARRRSAAGERGPLWIGAVRQTAGFGRRGRVWSQEEGDFAATFLFSVSAPRDALGQLSFVAALAVIEAVERFAPPAPLKLKWPNDILLGGRKCAGMLLELMDAPGDPLIALGIGVNIVSAPTNTPYPTARLMDAAHGEAPTSDALIDAVDASFAAWLEIWRTHGFVLVREAWLKRAAGLGEEITVRMPSGEFTGRFENIDETGALMLRQGDETRIIAAGDVFFNPPPRQ